MVSAAYYLHLLSDDPSYTLSCAGGWENPTGNPNPFLELLDRDSDARAAAAECTRRSEAASFEKFLAAEQQQKDTIRLQVFTLIDQQNKLQETLSKKEQDVSSVVIRFYLTGSVLGDWQ